MTDTSDPSDVAPLRVLDHGLVCLVEHWGSDEAVIEAARMSTGKGFLGWGGDRCPDCWTEGRLAKDGLFIGPENMNEARDHCKCKGTGKTIGDEKLLRYLWKNAHTTPFEMGGAIFEVAAPIFVFREWHRHRMQSYNELSARYTPLPDVNYLPTIERLMQGGGANRQAQGLGILTREHAAITIQQLQLMYTLAQKTYEHALEAGVPKELARLCLPVARYSKMRASANLLNWLRFLRLRMAENAMWEIREYANAVHSILAQLFPRTLSLFDEER